MAAITAGLGPRGFSFDASLTMVAGSRFSSRARSSIGLPGTYGARRATYSRATGASWVIGDLGNSIERRRVRPQQLEKGRLAREFCERGGDGRVGAMPDQIDEEQ